ncbi:MAG: NADH-quinone oxidoreductase subunit N [Prolixibacteraceae bacterium]
MIDIASVTADLIKSISLFKPETTLTVGIILAILFDLIFKKPKHIAGYIAIASLVVSGWFLIQQSGTELQTFQNMMVVDSFGIFMKLIILISTILIILFSFFSKELNPKESRLGEYFILILGMAFGMFLLVGAANLVMIYLAIETMSISSYILAGYTKEIKRASEASLKYVIFGAVSSAIMLYGISILFGLTGSLNLFVINQQLVTGNLNTIPVVISGIMIVAGFAYKISAVPFHFWTPDVYEGAPITITAYLSVASKAAGFAVLLRFFKTSFVDSSIIGETWHLVGGFNWHSLLAILAILTMTLGNLVALWQDNLKRMLAYSSIAHAGYLLMAASVLDNTGVTAIMIYFFFYMIMNLGAFFVVQLVADKINSEDVNDYTGLGHKYPLLGVCFTIFLVSLTGLPPTAGFIGKFYVFTSVVDAGYIWLAVIGVLNSVVSLYYYMKVVRNMYLRQNETETPKVTFSPIAIVIVVALAIPTLVLGLYFGPIVEWANSSMNIFIG